MKPIYKPSGKAAEYGDLAINIYTGCPHRCSYCYAPLILKRDRETFHSVVNPRKNIVEEVKKQLDREQITGKLIHLCFTCDPYPIGVYNEPTREIIKAIKASGNHVQILTKGGKLAERDFDLLGSGDWFGVTITGEWDNEYSINAAHPCDSLNAIEAAHNLCINTWVSCEPVYYPENIYKVIAGNRHIDLFRIGKLNYEKSGIDWAEFGALCERLCKERGRNYYIKDGLRKIMEEQS